MFHLILSECVHLNILLFHLYAMKCVTTKLAERWLCRTVPVFHCAHKKALDMWTSKLKQQ